MVSPITATTVSSLSTPHPKPFTVSEGPPPSFIDFGGSLPESPGNYIIYDYASTLRYVSFDGSIQGDLLQYHNTSEDTSFLPRLYSTTEESPRLIFIDDSEKEAFRMWITDLTGDLQSSWLVTVTSGLNCKKPSVSSHGRWLATKCHDLQGDYIYILDMASGQERMIDLGSCNINMEYELGFGFVKEKSLWFIPCNDSGLYCFISGTEGGADCKQLNSDYLPIINSSPDDSEIVLLKDDISYFDGTVSGKGLSIVARTCLFVDGDCKETKKFSLPYYKPINPEEIRGPIINTVWDSSGEKLVWLLAPIEYFGGREGITQGHATSGIIDIENNTNQVLWDFLPKRTNLLSISPDNEWLLFSDSQGLFLGSIKTKSIRRLVTIESGALKVMNWLVIP